ncbi:MAG: cation:proton antiporter [Wenzhouxiangellaceae bacterium]
MEALYHLAVIWVSVLLAAWLSHKTRLTPALWCLAAGSVLANLGLFTPDGDEFIRGFAELGIIFIMFALGFEENTANFMRSIKRSWGIALFGALAPFMVAYWLAQWFWQDSAIALLCGLAMTATAVSLTMVSLRDEGLHTSQAATGIMTSAVLDDIASLILVAIVVPMVTSGADLALVDVLVISVKAVLFFLLVTVVGLWLFPHDLRAGWLSRLPWIRRYGIRDLIGITGGGQATLVLLLMALTLSLIGYAFGFHPAVGAYLAGLILKEEYFHLQDREPDPRLYQQAKSMIDDIAFTWVGPVFFVTLGARLLFDAQLLLTVVDQVLILTLALMLAQIISAALAARYTGRFDWPNSVMIGLGMLGRAELAFVVMDIAYVQHAIFTREVFYTLMLTAFCLNIAVPLSIRWWRPRYLGDKPVPAWMRVKQTG